MKHQNDGANGLGQSKSCQNFASGKQSKINFEKNNIFQ
jgi:hypothetical protein